MEIVGLAVVVIVAAWYGFFKPAERLAHMADDEVAVMAAERKAGHVDTLKALSVTEEDEKQAIANLTRLSNIKL